VHVPHNMSFKGIPEQAPRFEYRWKTTPGFFQLWE